MLEISRIELNIFDVLHYVNIYVACNRARCIIYVGLITSVCYNTINTHPNK